MIFGRPTGPPEPFQVVGIEGISQFGEHLGLFALGVRQRRVAQMGHGSGELASAAVHVLHVGEQLLGLLLFGYASSCRNHSADQAPMGIYDGLATG
jgi:hypothetical protein